MSSPRAAGAGQVQVHPPSRRVHSVPSLAMAKRMKSRSYPDNDAATSPEPVLTGIAKAAQELSVAVEEFDRQAASWSQTGDLVRT